MDRTSQIPAVSPPGAWQRGSELRQHASPDNTRVQPHHRQDGDHGHDGGDPGGMHHHQDLATRLDGLEGRLDEHDGRLKNAENALRPRKKPR